MNSCERRGFWVFASYRNLWICSSKPALSVQEPSNEQQDSVGSSSESQWDSFEKLSSEEMLIRLFIGSFF